MAGIVDLPSAEQTKLERQESFVVALMAAMIYLGRTDGPDMDEALDHAEKFLGMAKLREGERE